MLTSVGTSARRITVSFDKYSLAQRLLQQIVEVARCLRPELSFSAATVTVALRWHIFARTCLSHRQSCTWYVLHQASCKVQAQRCHTAKYRQFSSFIKVELHYCIQGGPRKSWHTIFYALTLLNINRFSKLFHCQNQEKFVIILSLKISLHLKCVATLPYKMSAFH